MEHKHIQILPVRLTEDELTVRRDELVQELLKREIEDQARKDAAKDARDRIAVLDAEISRLARVIREREEPRPVECIDERNYERGSVDTIRQDTGEVVSVRAMHHSERQVVMLAGDDFGSEAGA